MAFPPSFSNSYKSGVLQLLLQLLLLLFTTGTSQPFVQGSRPGCVQGVTYSAAVSHCAASGGLRLCTLTEINSQIGQGTGCSFDAYHVWTSSSCGANQYSIATTGSADGTYTQAAKPPECTLESSTTAVSSVYGVNNIAVQCCVLITPAPTTPAPTTPAPTTPAPTTPAPTTPAPTTPAPTTPAPTTPAPTTPAPTTPAPTTPAPTTPAPTTPAPTTPAPTTPAPITPAPITPVPNTPDSDDSNDGDDNDDGDDDDDVDSFDSTSISGSDSQDINFAFRSDQKIATDDWTASADDYKFEIDLSFPALCILSGICVLITAIFWMYQCHAHKLKSRQAPRNDIEVEN